MLATPAESSTGLSLSVCSLESTADDGGREGRSRLSPLLEREWTHTLQPASRRAERVTGRLHTATSRLGALRQPLGGWNRGCSGHYEVALLRLIDPPCRASGQWTARLSAKTWDAQCVEQPASEQTENSKSTPVKPEVHVTVQELSKRTVSIHLRATPG